MVIAPHGIGLVFQQHVEPMTEQEMLQYIWESYAKLTKKNLAFWRHKKLLVQLWATSMAMASLMTWIQANGRNSQCITRMPQVPLQHHQCPNWLHQKLNQLHQ